MLNESKFRCDRTLMNRRPKDGLELGIVGEIREFVGIVPAGVTLPRSVGAPDAALILRSDGVILEALSHDDGGVGLRGVPFAAATVRLDSLTIDGEGFEQVELLLLDPDEPAPIRTGTGQDAEGQCVSSP